MSEEQESETLTIEEADEEELFADNSPSTMELEPAPVPITPVKKPMHQTLIIPNGSVKLIWIVKIVFSCAMWFTFLLYAFIGSNYYSNIVSISVVDDPVMLHRCNHTSIIHCDYQVGNKFPVNIKAAVAIYIICVALYMSYTAFVLYSESKVIYIRAMCETIDSQTGMFEYIHPRHYANVFFVPYYITIVYVMSKPLTLDSILLSLASCCAFSYMPLASRGNMSSYTKCFRLLYYAITWFSIMWAGGQPSQIAFASLIALMVVFTIGMITEWIKFKSYIIKELLNDLLFATQSFLIVAFVFVH